MAVRASAASADDVTAALPTVVPTEVIDSDRALEIVEANGGSEFRDRHSAQAVTVSLRDGNVPRLPDGSGNEPVGIDEPVWRVEYTVSGPFDQLTLCLDMRTVTLELAEAAEVRVAVYDAIRREVAVLADGLRTAGAHRLAWDATGFPAGTYLCRACSVEKLMASSR